MHRVENEANVLLAGRFSAMLFRLVIESQRRHLRGRAEVSIHPLPKTLRKQSIESHAEYDENGRERAYVPQCQPDSERITHTLDLPLRADILRLGGYAEGAYQTPDRSSAAAAGYRPQSDLKKGHRSHPRHARRCLRDPR